MKKDLESFSSIELIYEKAKLDPKNKKVISHIKYELKEREPEVSPNEIKKIAAEGRGASTNLQELEIIIDADIKKHSRTYLLRNLNFAKKYYSENFNEFFKKSIEKNSFYNNDLNYEVLPFNSKIVEFTNLNQLRKDLFTSLNGISIRKKYFTLSSDFSKELYNINQSLLLDYKSLRIYLEKVKDKKILIEIFLKKEYKLT